MKRVLLFLAVTCTLATACMCGKQKEESYAVPMRASLIHNPDSLAYYAELAYLHDDPKGLFVTAAAAYVRQAGNMPDSLTTVPISEAEIMLLHSAELGYPDAIKAIKCLNAHGCWHHSIPETK